MLEHKIDGTKPNQNGNNFGEKKREREKQGKQTEDNGQESSHQRTSSPGRDTEDTT